MPRRNANETCFDTLGSNIKVIGKRTETPCFQPTTQLKISIWPFYGLYMGLILTTYELGCSSKYPMILRILGFFSSSFRWGKYIIPLATQIAPPISQGFRISPSKILAGALPGIFSILSMVKKCIESPREFDKWLRFRFRNPLTMINMITCLENFGKYPFFNRT